MKKYTLFLFVFFLSFILLGFNVNSAKADVSGCMTGDSFSRTTGQACGNTSAVVTCPAGDLFSSVTGQPCTSVTSGGGSGGPSDNSSDVAQFNALFKSNFKIGLRGSSDVKALQQFLKDQGYFFGKIDGSYGKISARAVKDFQDDNDVTTTIITPPTITNPQSPVISGVSGPQTLDVNQTGTWIVTASDPNGGNLSYEVVWGDEPQSYTSSQALRMPTQQSATFTHSYSQARNYTPTFTVRNYAGYLAQTSLSVNVGNVIAPFPGFYMSLDKSSYVPNDAMTVNISRTDGSTVPYPIDVYFVGINKDKVQLSARLLVGQNTNLYLIINQQKVYSGPGQYLILLCDAGQICNGGVNTNALGFNVTSGIIQPSITVLSPNGGETWANGTKQTIKWQDNTPVSACPAGADCMLALKSYDINLIAAYSSPCSGGMACTQQLPIYQIAKNIPINYYDWTVGAIQGLYDGLAPEGSYTIQVCQSGTSICDSSDSFFKIVNGNTELLSITTTSPLPNAKVGTDYKAYLYASGGFNTYRWSVSSGSLPSGLTLTASSDCGITNSGRSNVSNCILIVGTPATAGTYNFSLTATLLDGSQSVTKQFTLTVDPATTISTITILYPNKDRSSYDVAPNLVSWTNSIPVTTTTTFLLQLNAVNISGYTSGQTIISETLTSAQAGCGYAAGDQCAYSLSLGTGGGTYTVMVKNLQNNVSDSITFTVNGTTTPLAITTTSLPSGTVGASYVSEALSASGGDGTYDWSVTGLPSGLSFCYIRPGTIVPPGVYPSPCLNSGKISGTPTTAGTYPVTVTVTSGAQSVSKQFSLVVSAASTTCVPTAILKPAGTIVATAGKVNLSWRPVPGAIYYDVRLDDGTTSRYDDVRYSSCGDPNPHYYCENHIIATQITDVPVIVGHEYIFWVDTEYSPSRAYCNGSTTFTVASDSAGTASVLGEESFHFTQFLEQGLRGNEVMELQKFLNGAGYDAGTVDGVFGLKVKAAVSKFQTDNGLKVDGIVGYEVRTVLNK